MKFIKIPVHSCFETKGFKAYFKSKNDGKTKLPALSEAVTWLIQLHRALRSHPHTTWCTCALHPEAESNSLQCVLSL